MRAGGPVVERESFFFSFFYVGYINFSLLFLTVGVGADHVKRSNRRLLPSGRTVVSGGVVRASPSGGHSPAAFVLLSET